MRKPLAAFAAAAFALLTAVPPAANAQGEPQGDISLVGQTPWVSGAGSFELRLRVSAEDDGLFVRVATHRRVRSRSDFAATLDERPRTATIDATEVSLREVRTDESGALVLPVPIIDADAPGVYPLRVELRSSEGRPIDGFTTYLVRLPTAPDPEPLRVAVVLPIHAQPALLPDGTVRLSDDGARNLADTAVALARNALPLSILATPETLEALEEQNENVVSTLGAATSGRQLLPRTYVAMNLAATVNDDVPGLLPAAWARGNGALASILATPPTRSTAMVDTAVSTRAVEELRRLGVQRFVLPADSLEELSTASTLTAPFDLEIGGASRAPAAEVDAGLAAHFAAAPDDPVLAANQLLADLALVAAESPGEPRGVVVAPDEPWQAEPAFVQTVLSALSGAGSIMRPVTLDGYFSEVPPQRSRRGRLTRSLVEGSAPGGFDPGAVQATRSRLASFAGLLDEDNPLPLKIESAVFASVATGTPRRVHLAYLAGANARIDAQLSLLQAPERRSITLTARRGEIPITVRNGAPYSVRIRLRLVSDTLDFPSGEVRDLELAPGAHTERFAVETRSSGAFRLRVVIESPDGALQVASSRLTVRSTAASGVGLALSAGAGGFLLVWWGSHLRGRRSRRLVPA